MTTERKVIKCTMTSKMSGKLMIAFAVLKEINEDDTPSHILHTVSIVPMFKLTKKL